VNELFSVSIRKPLGNCFAGDGVPNAENFNSEGGINSYELL